MRNLLTISVSLIAVLFFFSNAFPCGMMNRGTNRGMMCQNMMKNSGEETSHAMSHDKIAEDTSHAMSHDKIAIEKEESDFEPSTLVANKCSICHSLNNIFLSRKADWSLTVHRMNGHFLMARNMPLLTDKEKGIITNYLNTYYSLTY